MNGYSSVPFPEVGEEGSSSTNEQLLRKDQSQRFGKTGAYRDVPFAVLFLLQLVLVLVVAVGSRHAVARPATPPSSHPAPIRPMARGRAAAQHPCYNYRPKTNAARTLPPAAFWQRCARGGNARPFLSGPPTL